MIARIVRLLVVAGLLGGGPLAAQSFQQDISLSGLGNGNPARPFGITLEPESGLLFVGVAGAVGAGLGNDVVAVIDPASGTVVATIGVGLFPEDIAFAHDAQGRLLYGAVTNSSDGTVSIWDPSLSVVATVPIPDTFGFGSFPFGITAEADGSRFWVTTQEGAGNVFAVDTATLALDHARTINIGPRAGARLRALNGRLFIPDSEFTGAFDGSLGGLTAHDGGATPAWQRLLVRNEGQFVYPAGQDLELLPDGTLVLGGSFFDNRLYHLSQDGEILRSLRLSAPGGGVQGLALSPDGSLLAACDLAGDALVLVDMLNFRELSVTDLAQVGLGYGQPNEAVFLDDRLFVTCQANEEVVVFDNLPTVVPGPGYAGELVLSDSAPYLGSTVTATVTGPGLVALLLALDDLPGPFQGALLDIGPQPRVMAWGRGSCQRSFQVPHQDAARGRNVFFQGVVDVRNTRRPTPPRVAVIQ